MRYLSDPANIGHPGVMISLDAMSELFVDGRRVAWRVLGSGPPLLAPECNYTWTPSMVEAMSRDFTVIVATPTDFGASERVGAPYVPARWAAEMCAVLDLLGVERCGVFGYSFTGAFGPWLAQHLPDRVVAVVAGGFPLLGNYDVTAVDVRSQLAALVADPARYRAIYTERFDPHAGMAFYDNLAFFADDSLVDSCPCPLYCFWGDADTDAVAMVMPSIQLSAGLAQRGVAHQVIAGFDHEALNSHLEAAWPDASAWLSSHLTPGGAT
jgi:pimeloyl-ACP methyl ester carboxylesterase